MGKYQYMNLEQKLAKIRKKMPLLLKKNHNDEEGYDFATLDDIYESLTPALNKYGVNFEAVKETPTQYGPEGKPVYLTLDQDNFWRYEADLEICWTNIDNPKEANRAVTHIVGTHEIPDKAHGTALTYGLKYYFRNKFCMRQLGSVQEDPDGMEYGTGGKDTEKASASQNENGKGSRPAQAQPEGENRKERKHEAEPEKNEISGNAIPETKKDPEPAQKETKAGDGKHGKPQKNMENQKAEEARQPKEDKDGFQTASAGEVPFEDGSFLDELEQEMEEQTKGADSDLEAAKKYVCTFGLYNGKTLGEMMNSGLKCREAVKWIANRYKGTDQGMVEAAKLLLANQDLAAEQQAA